MKSLVITFLIIAVLVAVLSFSDGDVFETQYGMRGGVIPKESHAMLIPAGEISPCIRSIFVPCLDTVYVKDSVYVMLSLNSQKVTVHQRDSIPIEFDISSGNPDIKEGLATPTGLFTVQSKSVKAISKQFEDAVLHWWIGFNYNIGFHGLDGNGYYWNLGRRPSSHGCVRISREDGERLFGRVHTGTPVLVFDETPALVLAFTPRSFDTSQAISLGSRSNEMLALMKKRRRLLLRGYGYALSRKAVYLNGKTQLRPGGYDVGRFVEIPFEQTELPMTEQLSMKSDNCRFPLYVTRPKLHHSTSMTPKKDSILIVD